MAYKRDLLLVGGGRLLAVVLSLIAIRATTTFLTPTQYGELALLTSVQMFCGLFLVNPVGQHINLHTHAWWDDGTLLARLKSYRHYIVAVSLTGCMIILSMNRESDRDAIFWNAAASFSMIAATTWNTTLIPMLNMLGFRGASVFWTTFTVCLGLLASTLLVRVYPGAVSWFGGQAIGMAAGALGARRFIRRNAGCAAANLGRKPLLDSKTLLAYCLPLSLATGLMWLQISGYRFLVEHFWGLAQLGFLAVGLQLAAQVWTLAESLTTQFLYPLFYRRLSLTSDDLSIRGAYSDLLNTLIPVYLVLTGVLIATAPALLKLLVAPKFHDAVGYVVLGAFIELFRVMGSLLGNAAHARRQTKSLSIPYGVGAAVALGLIGMFGFLQMPLLWSAVALAVAGAASFAVMLREMHKQLAITPDVPRLIAAVSIMVVTSMFLALRPQVPEWRGAFLTFGIGAVAACIALYGLLRANQAMYRMLLIELRNK